jgi:hypothetical protein
MSLRQPPRLAARLLERCLTGKRSESLLGDLLEEYQTGRTPGWYWREALAALLLLARREARELCSRAAALLVPALIGQWALLVGLMVLLEPYREGCPPPPAALSGAITLLTGAGLAEVAISLMLWLRSLLRPLQATRRPAILRLALLALVTVGFGGGALSWAGTSSCSPLAHAARADFQAPLH